MTRYILSSLALLMLGSCQTHQDGCDFRKAEVTTPAAGGTQKKETLSDCFHKVAVQSPPAIEIKGDTLGDQFMVRYTDAIDQGKQQPAMLDTLTVKYAGTQTTWLKRDSNSIAKFEKADSLGLIFEKIRTPETQHKHVGPWGAILFRK